MKTKINSKLITTTNVFQHLGLAALAACFALASLPALGRDQGRDNDDGYQQVNLVSDLSGNALVTDTNLVNAWGISSSPTGPFWISDNGTGKSTLYSVTNDSAGDAHVTPQSLVVAIPGEGTPTGQLFDGAGHFNGDVFIFASEDGIISGWRGSLGNAAEILVAASNTVYKGIILDTNSGAPLLLAANFAQATVDAYDTNLLLVAQFRDPHAPRGFAPFNLASIDGTIFVTFAKQNAAKHDDVAGPGNGLIDILLPRSGKFVRFATGSNAGGRLAEINSPWGMTVAPRSFGRHADQLLVGNFGVGTIMTFDASGEFRGLLENAHDKPVVIDGLWGLAFGNGGAGGVTDTLYFTAGPAGESHGLFGSLAPVRDADDKHHHEPDPDRR